VNWAKVDPDLDPVRDHPRFKAMLAAAEARLAQVASDRPWAIDPDAALAGTPAFQSLKVLYVAAVGAKWNVA